MARDEHVRLQLRKLALQVRELTGHVTELARLARIESPDTELRDITLTQLTQELVDLTDALSRFLDDLPAPIPGAGNGC